MKNKIIIAFATFLVAVTQVTVCGKVKFNFKEAVSDSLKNKKHLTRSRTAKLLKKKEIEEQKEKETEEFNLADLVEETNVGHIVLKEAKSFVYTDEDKALKDYSRALKGCLLRKQHAKFLGRFAPRKKFNRVALSPSY
ncbi:hypothetical protein KAH94_05590 [bacterium]|nr:hypothetical protein [bacterium]